MAKPHFCFQNLLQNLSGANLGYSWRNVIVWFMMPQSVHSNEAVFPEVGLFMYFQSNSQHCLSLVVFTYLGKDNFAWLNTLWRNRSYNDAMSWFTQAGAVSMTLSLIWLLSLNWHHQLMTLSLIWLLTEFDITEYRFPWSICNGCVMPTGDAYSSGHMVLSHIGACKCSNVETNLFWTCLVSGLLSFEHPSVLLFLFLTRNLFEVVIEINKWGFVMGIESGMRKQPRLCSGTGKSTRMSKICSPGRDLPSRERCSERNVRFIQYWWNDLCGFISLNLLHVDIKHTISFIYTV